MAITKVSRGLLSTGISDSSNATAITIDSSENVGIGTTSPNEKLEVAGNVTLTPSTKNNSPSANATISDINFVGRTDNTVVAKIGAIHNDNANGTDGQLLFFTADNTASAAAAERMRITSTGDLKFNSGFGSVGAAYGVRAWVRFKGNTGGTGNRQVNGSGNVSTVGYIAAGRYRMNFTNSMPDVYYAVSATAIGINNHNPQSASIDINNSNNVAYVDLAYGPSGGASSVSLSNDTGAEYNAMIVR